jgi:hypothetical protein
VRGTLAVSYFEKCYIYPHFYIFVCEKIVYFKFNDNFKNDISGNR